MRHGPRWRMRTLSCLALGALALSACEAVIGLGAYSEGPAPDGGEAGASKDSGKGHDVTVPTDGGSHDGKVHDASPSDATGQDVAQDAPVCSTDGAASCSTTASCEAFQTSCSTAFCSQGCCAVAHREAGTSCSDAGDVCDDAGVCVQCTAGDHCPSLPCNVATCNGGACTYAPMTADAACAANGGSKCSQAGDCVECLAASDCSEHPCYVATCSSGGACVYSAGNSGGLCGTGGTCNDAGVCNQCNCSPLTALCKVSTCPGCGMANAAPGTPCKSGSATVCNDAGSCVACNVPTDCPAPTKACTIATCVNNMCGEGAANPNTPCNANGGSVCNTTAQCVMCTPSYLHACSGSTPFCSIGGACVECTTSTQCPGSTPYCIAAGTCVQCTSTAQCGLLQNCSAAGVCVPDL